MYNNENEKYFVANRKSSTYQIDKTIKKMCSCVTVMHVALWVFMAPKKHRHVSIVIGKVNVVINEINEILLTKCLHSPFRLQKP